MALIPLRNLDQFGTITDVDPLALPLPAWSRSMNMRFENNSVSRGPHFRKVGTLSQGTPSFVYGTPIAETDGSEFLVAMQDGRIQRWTTRGKNGEPGIETDLTEAEWSPSVVVDEPMTAVELQQVIYTNRPDRPLWTMRKTGEQFEVAPGWNPEWRCKAVRALNNQVIAIGVQRNGRYYPAMVKFSDFTIFAEPTLEWNAQTNNSAGENILGSLAERLVDGLPLRGRMYLYAQHGVYAMTPRADNFIYDFQQVFSDKGVISPNCIVEVENLHYVFGTENLWAHEGSNVLWTTDGGVTRNIFDHLVREAAHRFFVIYNRDRQEIMFCHVSTHPDCKFPVGKGNVPNDLDPYPGCNRSATFHIRTNKWSFDDLPYVVGGAIVTPATGVRWDELNESWDDLGDRSWLDLGDRSPRLLLMVSPVRTANAQPRPKITVEDDEVVYSRTLEDVTPTLDLD